MHISRTIIKFSDVAKVEELTEPKVYLWALYTSRFYNRFSPVGVAFLMDHTTIPLITLENTGEKKKKNPEVEMASLAWSVKLGSDISSTSSYI